MRTEPAVGLAVCFILLIAFYHRQSFTAFQDHITWEDTEQEGALRKLLQKAQLRREGGKTVIFTSVNAAWAEPGSLLDIFMESFKMLSNKTQEDLLNHLIVLAFDQKAYERCMEVHPLCYQVRTSGVDFSSAKPYMSHDYVKMMWRRIEFLITILKMGYNFIFSDADIIWLRNPFPYLSSDRDFEISTDRYNGNSSSHDNAPNGGYTFARSNSRTIRFYKFWYDSRLTHAPKHEQDVFIDIRHNETIRDIGVKIGYLDTKFFGSFCSHWVYNMSVSLTMHANCCNGLQNKIRNLRGVLSDWKEFNVNNSMVRAWKHPIGCPLSLV